MSDPIAPHYPDILGYVTGGTRAALGPVEAALAVRPMVARVDAPVEVLLLLQNITDASVTINAVLHLPEGFTAPQPDLNITLFPAEVGYITLPMTTHNATQPELTAGVEVEAVAQHTHQIVRQAQRDLSDYYDYFRASSVAPLRSLHSLEFAASSRQAGDTTVLEAPFYLISRTSTCRAADVSAGWTSLWTLDNMTGTPAQIQRYSEIILERFLPVLTEEHLIEPLRRSTEERTRLAGYNIQPVEADYLARMMVAVLSLAAMPPGAQPTLYHVGHNLRQPGHVPGRMIPLPNWCRGLLDLLASDARPDDQPTYALATLLYDDLLRDAVALGFDKIRAFTGASFGSEDDEYTYAEHLLNILSQADSEPVFTDIYLPLVLGGIIVDQQAALSQRARQQRLAEIDAQVQQRWMERTDESEPIFALVNNVIRQLTISAGEA